MNLQFIKMILSQMNTFEKMIEKMKRQHAVLCDAIETWISITRANMKRHSAIVRANMLGNWKCMKSEIETGLSCTTDQIKFELQRRAEIDFGLFFKTESWNHLQMAYATKLYAIKSVEGQPKEPVEIEQLIETFQRLSADTGN